MSYLALSVLHSSFRAVSLARLLPSLFLYRSLGFLSLFRSVALSLPLYSPVSRTRVKFKMQTVIDSNWTLSLLHFSMLCVHARARAFSLARSFPLLLANFTRSLSHPPSMFFSLPIPRLRGGPRCSFRKRILSNSTFTDRYLSWRLRHSGMICGV